MKRLRPRLAVLPWFLLALCVVLLGTRAAGEELEAEESAKLSNTLRWTTASEIDNFGFDVYRGDQEEGPFARLTREPIPGAGTTDVPTQYEYVDDTIKPDREYFYYVESIALDGRREHFTPVVRVAPKHRPAP